MIVIALQHPKQHEFLLQVLDEYSKRGMPANELPLAADTFLAVANARDIPVEQHLGKAEVVEAGPNGIALEIEHP